MKETTIESFDGKEISLRIWDQVEEVKGIIQLVHGSCEHSLRYNNFANFMNDQGWIVIGSDHRGHGKTANLENKELGYFSDNDGWNTIIKDLKEVNNFIKSNFTNTKIVMLGHSMGSFMARNYIIDFGNTIDGCILSGTSWYSKTLLKFSKLIASKRQSFYGSKNIDKFIWKLSYQKFNNKFKKEGITGVEWLSIDKNNVENFVNDPLCWFIFTTSAFKDLFTGLLFIQKKANIKKIRKDLKILLISGKDDPVGNFSKKVKKTYRIFKNKKLDVKIKLYDKLRHEILFDLSKEQVYIDILEFLKKLLK
ncbi:alpha/beta fold hydrolase [Spiroplasma taiwanense]|uniref:Lysophospholipase n=1 Tax=Spiroplasma taiwanense CT-1 TaxID=1276220 RepID=S5LW92_9MOLU|nr:alpha/beta hydrolase [Spiroplasma taiwanense]AGR40876.1 lysophospholipase [Spiroplasma taiwanense CT-1]